MTVEDVEYEWECTVCGCADLDITDQTYNGMTVYKCPDCGNRQDLTYLLKRIEELKKQRDRIYYKLKEIINNE